MESVDKIAYTIRILYKEKYQNELDLPKLKRLLYFVQRECIICTDEPMFKEPMMAGEFGPTIKLSNTANDNYNTLKDNYLNIINATLDHYGKKKTYSLNTLALGEYSIKNANGNYISVDDIKVDAQRIKMRREYFNAKQ